MFKGKSSRNYEARNRGVTGSKLTDFWILAERLIELV